MHYPRSFITSITIAISILILSRCINKEEDKSGISNVQQFAGSATCANCHKDISAKHIRTAHFLTSHPAVENFIKGNFEPGNNIYSYDDNVQVAMEKRDSGLFQVEYFKGIEKKARRFDLIIGSGTKGQSYCYWMNNHLFQLPITYFTAANAWSNSPGFPDKVVFNRVITSRCLECHSTYAKTISPQGKEPEQFAGNSMIYGVDCEKCHGGATRHVEYHTQNPNQLIGKYIINPARLTRQQNLDLCALCHGGRLQKSTPSFAFQVGDTLSHHFILDTLVSSPENIDVHGNQYGLLRSSKCFRLSTTMTCNSCHNTHENEKGNTALFSQRCMTCHNNEHDITCKLSKRLGKSINTNCIDCHMPVKPSRAIAVQLIGGNMPVAAMIRSHFISIYPSETQKVIAVMKKLK